MWMDDEISGNEIASARGAYICLAHGCLGDGAKSSKNRSLSLVYKMSFPFDSRVHAYIHTHINVGNIKFKW